MIYSILFVILAGISYWYWRHKYVPREVAQNAADFVANGSLDNLQRGYHGREVWSRVWPGLACCVVPSVAPAAALWLAWKLFDVGQPISVWAVLLAFAATAALLLGVFVRDFTPKLNLARIANGDTWLATEWYASPASKSWPDASAWVKIRRETNTDNQAAANAKMKSIILRTYRLCLAASVALATAAVLVAVNS